MNHRSRTTFRTLAALTIASFAPAVAQDFGVGWYTIDGGGEMWTTGGDYELSGTVGQLDASEFVMTGGDFELTGGFWPGTCFLLGDLNHDGTVNISDLAQLLGNYGTTSGATYEDGDLNGDGAITLPDLAELLAAYGTTCP